MSCSYSRQKSSEHRLQTATVWKQNNNMLRTQSTKMHLLLLLVTMMMWDFMAMTAAQPRCDPLTQYEKHGECCKMCGPGTRMSSSNSCLDPQCTECMDNEYQDKYTNESMCKRQPYCDPNSNFEVVHMSKTKKSTCMCKEGFHCSSRECITCVSHTTCKAGHGAQYKGNHNRDTVCQNCTGGTFSNDESWDGVCKKWTECMDGHRIQQKGTDVSDNICEGTSRTHVIAAVCGIVVIGILVAIIFFYCVCKGKQGDAEGKVKACFKCLEDQSEPVLLRETRVVITNPTTEEESLMPELQSSQEEAGVMTPEENEDEHSQDLAVLTENGNYVTQENGKSTILSRQESQTQTFTD
ncbi:tumor necrosis factor receptor superfamily member 5 isoform X2 [Sebastes umbrosus]|uniref:tumor necrosis factor receptor superfamily member 5 isoform X2 n=1 Tax=Sebastes umbrosus TaxID=72105 RepID=UPI0018A06B7A|nr:tumor necrosis factor receptor superfamily member 5 isoform X2 [Sebastes umbrosus]